MPFNQDQMKRAPIPAGPTAGPSDAEKIAAALEPMIRRAVEEAVRAALAKERKR